jgi:O-antigen/teichoic acid export membrane protein
MYQLLILILPLITAPYVARVLGADGTGTYAYTYSIANYFILFAILGLNNYGNRSIAKIRDDKEELSKTFCNIYTLQFITAALAIVIYILYISFFLNDYWVVAICQLVYVGSALFDINWFFFGIEQFKLTVMRNTVIKLLSVGLVFLFVKSAEDLWMYTLIYAGGMMISNLVLWPFLRQFVYFKKPEIRIIKTHIIPNFILFIPILALSLYKIMDKIMLGRMSGMIQVGFYDNSEKIINIPMGIIMALGIVMLPKMSNLAANKNIEKSCKYLEYSLHFIAFLAPALTFGIAGIAPEFALIFYGEEFAACGSIITVLSPIILFISLGNVIRTEYLIPNNKDKIFVISIIIGAIINLTLNIFTIPKFGALGTAIATICAEASVAIVQTLAVWKSIPVRMYFNKVTVYAVIGTVMYLAIRIVASILGRSITTIAVEIILGSMVYIILSFLSLWLLKDDLLASIITGIKKRVEKLTIIRNH